MMRAMAAARAEGAPSSQARLEQFAWVALVTACFLLARPYLGIMHDGILYAAQALARADPQIYRDDVYFRWGSQDRYTLFTPILAWLGAPLGMGRAHLVLTVAPLALFLAASFALVRTLLPAGLRGFAMLLVAASAGHYGSQGLFRMAEPFVTPRPLAEAMTLAALVLLFTGRRWWALALLGACAFAHPLVALAGVLFWWIHALLTGANRWILAAMALAPLAAALAGVPPFDQLFATFDTEWFDKIYGFNRQLFILQWVWVDWARLLFDLAVIVLAERASDGPLRGVFRAARWTAVVAVLATFAGADAFHNVLLTNLQPWRALWIVHWLALAGLAVVVARTWKESGNESGNESEAGRLIAALLLFAFVTRGTQASAAATLLAAVLFAVRAQLVVSPALIRLIIAGLGAGALASWVNLDLVLFRSPLFPVGPAEYPWMRVLSRAFPVMVLAAAVVWFGLRRGAGWGTAAAAGAALAIALAAWDQRSPFSKYIDSVEPGQHPFSRAVAPGEQIWWHGPSLSHGRSVLLSWIAMQRPSFQSAFQHVGQHFSREVTLELDRRDDLTTAFQFQASICQLIGFVDPRQQCKPDFALLQELCEQAPELRYLALETDYPGKWIASWSPPAEIDGRVPRYHLYACKDILPR